MGKGVGRWVNGWVADWWGTQVYSPKATGIGLAQDTVFRRGQGVEPEVGGALVGSGL